MQSFTSLLTIAAGVRLFRCPPIRPACLLAAAEGSRVQRWREYLRGNASNFNKTTGVSMIRDVNGTDSDFAITSRSGRTHGSCGRVLGRRHNWR